MASSRVAMSGIAAFAGERDGAVAARAAPTLRDGVRPPFRS
ncbi:hypothetical protein GLA29479_3789 [Lysobacter antibioticus]|nr:hypothetical protein GLA29479_3789 [Lysobacter antibioticus]